MKKFFQRTIDLFRCVKALGFRSGWRYWRVQAEVNAEPALAIAWAESCERISKNSNNNCEYLKEWAGHLRKAHAEWSSKNQTQQQK